MRVSGFQNIPGAPGNLLADFNFLAQNQGPSTPVKPFYPPADNPGAPIIIAPNRGGAGIKYPVRYKEDRLPLAQDFTEDSYGTEQMLAQLRENQFSLPNGFINKYIS